MPLRFTVSICVLDDNSHPAIPIFVFWSTQDPDTWILHLYDRVNSLRRSELERFHFIWSRYGISVQSEHVKLMSSQRQFDGFSGARVQNPEHHPLAFLYANWIGVS